MIRIYSPTFKIRAGTVIRCPERVCLPGQVTFVVGPNGSGKTTLLDAMCGLRRPLSGGIEMLGGGGRVLPMRPTQLVRNGLGRSFQAPRVFSGLSVNGHFQLQGPVASEYTTAIVNSLLSEASINPLTPADQLSTGQRKIIGSLLAIRGGNRFCILDEPFAGLSGSLADFLGRVLADHAQLRGSTMVVAGHRLEHLPFAGNAITLEIP